VNTGHLDPLNYKGLAADASERQGFRGKYRSAARMIFPGTALRPDLAVRQWASANFAL